MAVIYRGILTLEKVGLKFTETFLQHWLLVSGFQNFFLGVHSNVMLNEPK